MTAPAVPPILYRCPSGQCDRLVASKGSYCCTPCSIAWESTPRWDVDGEHSDGCDARAQQRADHPDHLIWS